MHRPEAFVTSVPRGFPGNSTTWKLGLHGLGGMGKQMQSIAVSAGIPFVCFDSQSTFFSFDREESLLDSDCILVSPSVSCGEEQGSACLPALLFLSEAKFEGTVGVPVEVLPTGSLFPRLLIVGWRIDPAPSSMLYWFSASSSRALRRVERRVFKQLANTPLTLVSLLKDSGLGA